MAPSPVTVAICTWNRAALLKVTLERMLEVNVQDYPDWELLIVNNNCTDETDGVIAEFSARLPIRRLFESQPGLSAARNCALAGALHDWVVFTDDDVLVEPDWLAAFSAAVARHPAAVIAGGPIAPWFIEEPDPDFAAAFPELAMGFCGVNHDLAEGLLPEGHYVWGANFALRKSGLGSLRFNARIDSRIAVGEELDLLKRVRAHGGSILWIPDMRVRHYVDPSRMRLEYFESAGRHKAQRPFGSSPRGLQR